MGFFEDFAEGFIGCDDEERAAMDDEGLDPTCPEDRRLFRRLSDGTVTKICHSWREDEKTEEQDND